MNINRISSSYNKQNFGMAYLSYPTQSLIRTAKEACKNDIELNYVKALVVELEEVFPDRELFTLLKRPSFFATFSKKDKNFKEDIYIDDILKATVNLSPEAAQKPITRLKKIAEKLKELENQEVSKFKY